MGKKFSSFAIRGIDVSQYNGNVDWSYVEAMCHFASIRGGYGKVQDTQFAANWAAAKGKVIRCPYWYMDYYSNRKAQSGVYGLTDADWGVMQSNKCWEGIKDDPEGIVFLDIESASSSVATAITSNKTHALAIAKSFLLQMDSLNGKTNGIYCSVGLLGWFSAWFKDRPLWAAWYNESKTVETVLTVCAADGWTTPVIWQYASDGDLDDDSYGDGRKFSGTSATDLNGWIGSAEEFAALFGTAPKEIAVTETAADSATEESAPEYEYYRVTPLKGVNVRAAPSTKAAKILPAIAGGEKIRIESVADGWAKLYDRDGYVSADCIELCE